MSDELVYVAGFFTPEEGLEIAARDLDSKEWLATTRPGPNGGTLVVVRRYGWDTKANLRNTLSP